MNTLPPEHQRQLDLARKEINAAKTLQERNALKMKWHATLYGMGPRRLSDILKEMKL